MRDGRPISGRLNGFLFGEQLIRWPPCGHTAFTRFAGHFKFVATLPVRIAPQVEQEMLWANQTKVNEATNHKNE
jgi:hypothetical protein